MASSPNAVDPAAELKERFSRQIILPGVGMEGQKKWAETPIVLAGEGAVLEAATTALRAAGATQLSFLQKTTDEIPGTGSVLVLTEDKDFRRALSRRLRVLGRPTLYAWPMGTGWALFLATHKGGQCPCLECYEVMNPKAFGSAAPGVPRLMAAMAVSEALQWVLKPQSPLEGKVWATSLEAGTAYLHEVSPTYKCPARLAEEGAPVTP